MKKIKDSLKLNPRLQLIQFANQNASKAISNLLVGAGIPGGSAMTLRHSLASANMTNEERVELADKMAHSPATNLQYARKSQETTTMEIPNELVDMIKELLIA